MKPITKILLFILLPAIAPMLFPPATLSSGLPVVSFGLVMFILLGILVMRGRSYALTLTIFIQGVNVIVRLMMLFPHALTDSGLYDIPYILPTILSIALSTYILFRLDKVDIRSQMVS